MSELNLRTAMIIQGNKDKLKVITHRDKKTLEWGAQLWLTINEQLHSLLLSSWTVFETKKLAQDYMDILVDEVNKLELLTMVEEES